MRKAAGTLLVTALTFACLSLTTSPSQAAEQGTLNGKGDAGGITIMQHILEKIKQISQPASKGKTKSAGKRAARASVRLVPACTGNAVTGTRELCPSAILTCQRQGNPDSYFAWQYLGLPSPGDPTTLVWHMLGSRCVRSREPATARPAFVLTLQDFQRLPLPPGALNIEPGTGPVLINIPTNFYVKAAPVPLTATVLGTRIEVIATPVNYHWTFGDGTTLDTTDPGGPYPDMTTTHTYAHPGPQTITLTTSYTGRYRVAGSPDPTWLPVDGTAAVTSPPRTITLIETRAVLVN